jgi:hypothetical protein
MNSKRGTRRDFAGASVEVKGKVDPRKERVAYTLVSL